MFSKVIRQMISEHAEFFGVSKKRCKYFIDGPFVFRTTEGERVVVWEIRIDDDRGRSETTTVHLADDGHIIDINGMTEIG